MVTEGLLEKTEPDKMENFKNVDPQFVDVYWDNGRHYTVPWQLGTTASRSTPRSTRATSTRWRILFNPPDELKGKINVFADMNDVINAAERYLGVPRCASRQGRPEEDQRPADGGQAELERLRATTPSTR